MASTWNRLKRILRSKFMDVTEAAIDAGIDISENETVEEIIEKLRARGHRTKEWLGDKYDEAADIARQASENVEREFRKLAARCAEQGPSAKLKRHYATLKLPLNTTLEQLETRWKMIQRTYHPDLPQNLSDVPYYTRLMQEYSEAYGEIKEYLETKDGAGKKP